MTVRGRKLRGIAWSSRVYGEIPLISCSSSVRHLLQEPLIAERLYKISGAFPCLQTLSTNCSPLISPPVVLSIWIEVFYLQGFSQQQPASGRLYPAAGRGRPHQTPRGEAATSRNFLPAEICIIGLQLQHSNTCSLCPRNQTTQLR